MISGCYENSIYKILDAFFEYISIFTTYLKILENILPYRKYYDKEKPWSDYVNGITVGLNTGPSVTYVEFVHEPSTSDSGETAHRILKLVC